MSLANPLWGAPRIHGELLKLGIEIGQTSVAKYMARHRKPVPIVNSIRLAYSRELGDACAYGRHPQTDLVGGKLVVSIKSFGCPYRKPNATSV
jgi:hypothetical protein